MQTKKFNVMRHLRLLLFILMAFVATNAALAINNLESFTDNNGITYRVYEYDVNSLYQYAVITNIQSSAYTLTIPGKVTRPNGREAIVHGFDGQFTCNCPNAAALVIAESTENGYVAGDFTGMPRLNNIWFYSSTTSPATGRSWYLDSSTRFAKPISVYLSELVSPATYSFITYYNSYNSLVSKWKSHSQVNAICCTHRYSDGNIGISPFAGNTNTTVEAAVTYIEQYANEIYVPAYSNSMKITRLGYPDTKTNDKYMRATSIYFEGDIIIGEDVDFSYFNHLKTMVFKGNANILHTDFSTYCPIEQIEFYGDAEYGSFSNLRQLKSVYFYGMPPSSYCGAYYNINNVTFYFNMDIYEIEEWKANHPVWADANIQPIDPRSSYRKVTISNEGEGTFKVRKQTDGHVTWAIINPNSTRTIEVDKGAQLWLKDFSLDESSLYRLYGFLLNDTYFMNENQMGIPHQITEKTNTLVAKYHRLSYPEGTQFNIHLSKIGDGSMDFYNNDENEWAIINQDTGEMQDLVGMEHDGDERDYVATYYEDTYMNMSFSCTYKKPVDGIEETLTVLANGIPQEPRQVDEDYLPDIAMAYYGVDINGDMDIKVINKDNGRKLFVTNGPGGQIDLYRSGVTEKVATINYGSTLEKKLPKATGHYVIIRPGEGKQVGALFVNKVISETSQLQLSPEQYLQDDGTYRVPLDDFEAGDDTYRLSVLYFDKPAYTFDLTVVGNGELKCTPYKRNGGALTPIRTVTASAANGLYQKAFAYYEEVGDNGYVLFRLSKPVGDDVLRVYWCGQDVANKFTPSSDGTFMEAALSANPTEAHLGMLMSSSLMALYEPASTDNPNQVNWDVHIAGNIDNNGCDISLGGGEESWMIFGDEPDQKCNFNVTDFDEDSNVIFLIYPWVGQTFRVRFNDNDVTDLFVNDRGTYILSGSDFLQFFVDGTWVITFEDAAQTDVIDFADAAVKAICVNHWDADRDGELSKSEAALVTTLIDSETGQSVFNNNQSITSFDEFKYFVNVKTIPTRGFSNCTALQTITLPESLEELQFLCFSGCNSLRTIELPVSLKIIGQSAFSQSGIKTLFVPKNVNSISYQIVSRCPNLVSLSVDKENQWYDSREGCNAVIRKSDDTLISGSSLTQIPEGVKGLGFGCFSENFETLVLPSTLEEISSSLSCPRLKQLVSKAVVPPTITHSGGIGMYNANCRLIVPAGTREAYIQAGWTEDIFRNGVVEEEKSNDGDVDCDGKVSVSDVTKLVDIILGN